MTVGATLVVVVLLAQKPLRPLLNLAVAPGLWACLTLPEMNIDHRHRPRIYFDQNGSAQQEARIALDRLHKTGEASKYPLRGGRRGYARTAERRTRTLREVVTLGRNSKE